MIIKYREHRGGLQESLDTAREFSTLKDCLQYVKGTYERIPGIPITLKDIEVSYYCYDDRVKQELYAVFLRLEHKYILGFIYEETECF